MRCQSTPRILGFAHQEKPAKRNPPGHPVGVSFRNLLTVPHIRAFAARWHRDLSSSVAAKPAWAWSPDVRMTVVERGTYGKRSFVMLQAVTRLGAHSTVGPLDGLRPMLGQPARLSTASSTLGGACTNRWSFAGSSVFQRGGILTSISSLVRPFGHLNVTALWCVMAFSNSKSCLRCIVNMNGAAECARWRCGKRLPTQQQEARRVGR